MASAGAGESVTDLIGELAAEPPAGVSAVAARGQHQRVEKALRGKWLSVQI
jgi:hypothetical protein